jgi:hypothetical protein
VSGSDFSICLCLASLLRCFWTFGRPLAPFASLSCPIWQGAVPCAANTFAVYHHLVPLRATRTRPGVTSSPPLQKPSICSPLSAVYESFPTKLTAHRKYRYMELSLSQRRKALSTKIPDIEQTLSVVTFLQSRRKRAFGEPEPEPVDEEDDDLDDLDDLGDEDEGGKKADEPLKSLFELNDTLYAEAEVQETGEVGLWLGVSGSSWSWYLFSVLCEGVWGGFSLCSLRGRTGRLR